MQIIKSNTQETPFIGVVREVEKLNEGFDRVGINLSQYDAFIITENTEHPTFTSTEWKFKSEYVFAGKGWGLWRKTKQGITTSFELHLTSETDLEKAVNELNNLLRANVKHFQIVWEMQDIQNAEKLASYARKNRIW